MSGEDTQTTESTQYSVTNPWTQSIPFLEKILGQYSGQNTEVTPGQQSALDKLKKSISMLPDFGGDATGAARKFFSTDTSPQIGMLETSYKDLQNRLGGTASGMELDPYKTPGFGTAIDTMTGDITDKVKGVYAGSGRNPSGAGSFAGSLGRGLTEGIAPTIANQFNTNKQNQLNAARSLFDAGGSTASGITSQGQVPLQNSAMGIGLLPQIMQSILGPSQMGLEAENMSFGLPFENLKQLLGPAFGFAGLGGSQFGKGNQKTSQPQSAMSNIFGGLSTGIGLLSLFSDERVKDEVEPIGKLNDGQRVVRFTYKGDPVMRIGLLAQEVEEVEPDAVDDIGGILAVDHRKATQRAAEIGRAH